MDAANRWETEAMRESRDRRSRRPTVSQDRDPATPSGEWCTLREASDLTGIPIGTLRKWCRRATIDSYLESDGELTLRMVNMASVRARSAALHGTDAKSATSHEPRAASTEERPLDPVPERETMIVPVDAWNKMLNQLGNLHEAGQQLAEARERAAKAETEALFLRERLAEMREEAASSQLPATSTEEDAEETVGYQLPATSTEEDAGPNDGVGDPGDVEPAETVSFWRYVARGWKGRRR
ncbi:MAG: hypothetical protein WCC01_02825 [Acidimicrobiia bacterium]